MRCPCCGERSFIRASEVVSPTLSKVYYACAEVMCGHTWFTHNEYQRTLSPSAIGPVRQTIPQLRLKPPRGPLSPGAPIPAPPDG
jgi:hypothetical protein